MVYKFVFYDNPEGLELAMVHYYKKVNGAVESLIYYGSIEVPKDFHKNYKKYIEPIVSAVTTFEVGHSSKRILSMNINTELLEGKAKTYYKLMYPVYQSNALISVLKDMCGIIINETKNG